MAPAAGGRCEASLHPLRGWAVPPASGTTLFWSRTEALSFTGEPTPSTMPTAVPQGRSASALEVLLQRQQVISVLSARP